MLRCREDALRTREASVSQRIVGIDPGLNVTGYGVLEPAPHGLRVVEAGVLRSKQADSLAVRLSDIYRGVREVLETHRPASMALEELYSHYERPQTAILMGHARGVICLAAAELNIAVHHYASTNIKKLLTGSGRAPKLQVQESIRRELRLTSVPHPPDVADALAIGICHLYAVQRCVGLATR